MIENAMSGMVTGAGNSCPLDGSREAATCIAAYDVRRWYADEILKQM